MRAQHKKPLVITLLSMGVALATSQALAKNGGEQGSTNGQPFQTLRTALEDVREDLQGQIDDLAADLQNQINCITDELYGTTPPAGMNCPDLGDSRVDELEANLATLEGELATLQTIVNNASCPDGQYLQVVNNGGAGPVCVADVFYEDQLVRQDVYGASVDLLVGETATATADCPVDTQLTGCGFVVTAGNLASSVSPNAAGNGCVVIGFGLTADGTVQAIANCAVVGPATP